MAVAVAVTVVLVVIVVEIASKTKLADVGEVVFMEAVRNPVPVAPGSTAEAVWATLAVDEMFVPTEVVTVGELVLLLLLE